MPSESFIVHLPDREIEYKQRGKLYMALWEEIAAVMITVQEAEAMHSKAEAKRAKEAFDLLKNSRYPSIEELIHLIKMTVYSSYHIYPEWISNAPMISMEGALRIRAVA